jgi:hypothetical protein
VQVRALYPPGAPVVQLTGHRDRRGDREDHMSAIEGLWMLYTWDETLPEPAWVFQVSGTELAGLLATMLRWRDQGQQVRLDWVAAPVPETGPEDYKIGTRHDDDGLTFTRV